MFRNKENYLEVEDGKCKLGAHIYGYWTKFQFGSAQAGDPKAKIILQCTEPKIKKTFGSASYPINLLSGSSSGIDKNEIYYSLKNSNINSVSRESIGILLDNLKSKYENEKR
ncbi:MAG: hypothetical protein Satyrvirus11_4 [Satyrvirus sp.]|uniref:Uncharacterized protein n=1 Tax=Satyrvirus sp. TaxID=2487771 RepID=A0A3G5ADR9_9VIRU|nr:MAG: hypothetical protein Satyrvirus11_4 [Satyrvirus sp.]